MASVRGLLNIQSLNELTYENRISPETSPKARILFLVSGSAAFVVPHPPQTRTV